jgi:hypothetical protein
MTTIYIYMCQMTTIYIYQIEIGTSIRILCTYNRRSIDVNVAHILTGLTVFPLYNIPKPKRENIYVYQMKTKYSNKVNVSPFATYSRRSTYFYRVDIFFLVKHIKTGK